MFLKSSSSAFFPSIDVRGLFCTIQYVSQRERERAYNIFQPIQDRGINQSFGERERKTGPIYCINKIPLFLLLD